jgi:hypothetical protein
LSKPKDESPAPQLIGAQVAGRTVLHWRGCKPPPLPEGDTVLMQGILEVRNLSGVHLSDTCIRIHTTQPDDCYQSWHYVSGVCPDGQKVQSIHEIDYLTGLTRPVSASPAAPPFKLFIKRVEKSIPWWRLECNLDIPDAFQWTVRPIAMNARKEPAYSDRPIWHWTIPRAALLPAVITKAEALIRAHIGRLRPTPAQLAADAMLSGIDLYEDAGTAALATQSDRLKSYLIAFTTFIQTEWESMLEDFVTQVALEGDLAARADLPPIDGAVTLAGLRSEARRKLGERHTPVPHRQKGTRRFTTKGEFLETAFGAVFTLLDQGEYDEDRVTQERVSRLVFANRGDEGKALRRELVRHELSWDDVRNAAIAAYVHACYPA